jgi:Pyruvate/2-oxoacid:ferredoxin oxidoreductase delta subunit
MSLKDQSILRVVLYEGQGARPLESALRYALLSALLERGYTVTRTKRFELADPSPGAGAVFVLGHFEGELPAWNGDRADLGRIRFQDITDWEADTVADTVADALEKVRNETATALHGEWKPWFPVIDYDRCTNCMQCLSFCLFNVYGVDGSQRIQVQNNDNCKTNCPACSRVCPEAAIMFPKYKSGPINGDAVSDADLNREKMKVDISSLLGGDVYELLRERSAKAKSRFSKERDANKALNERQKCLVKLAQGADIPAEVFMSLPSPEEIQRRAQEAMAKAEAARAGQAPSS